MDLLVAGDSSLCFFPVRPFNDQVVTIDSRGYANVSPEAGKLLAWFQRRIVNGSVERMVEDQ
jgi:hypothetical protein